MGEISPFWVCPVSSVHPRGITLPGSKYSWITTEENAEGEQKHLSLVWTVLGPNKSAIIRGRVWNSRGTWLWGATALSYYLDDPFIVRTFLLVSTIAPSKGYQLIWWRIELIVFWFPQTRLADQKGKYDSELVCWEIIASGEQKGKAEQRRHFQVLCVLVSIIMSISLYRKGSLKLRQWAGSWRPRHPGSGPGFGASSPLCRQ